MKKLYFLLTIAIIWANLAFSQILTLAPHSVLGYSGPDSVKLTSNVTIINNSANSLNVKAQMFHRTLAPNHYSYFCWTVCYDTSTITSPDSVNVGPGGSISSFEGWVGAQNYPGHDEITYRYYDMYGMSDTLYVTYTYDFTGVSGITEITAAKYAFNITGPNPANTYTNISYLLPGQKDERIIVTNLLGSKVNEFRLTNRASTIVIPVSDLNSGVYVYSLVIDGAIVTSKKLIVTHQ